MESFIAVKYFFKFLETINTIYLPSKFHTNHFARGKTRDIIYSYFL